MAGLQETKWFDAKEYRVTSGREVPSLGRSHQRDEGVALVLHGPAIIAWRNSGSQWKAWGSRIISAMLDCGEQLHVFFLLCSYSTLTTSRDEKDEFFNSL